MVLFSLTWMSHHSLFWGHLAVPQVRGRDLRRQDALLLLPEAAVHAWFYMLGPVLTRKVQGDVWVGHGPLAR